MLLHILQIQLYLLLHDDFTSFAPTCVTTDAVAVYVYAGTLTSSPDLTPSRWRTISIAAVAEFRQTVLSVCTYAEISCSSFFVRGPVVIHPERIAYLTSCASYSVMSGGENGTFIKIWIYSEYFYIDFFSNVTSY